MIGIIAAMDVEMKSLRSFMTDTKTETVSGITFVSGTLEGKLVVTAVCGIGKVFAAMCAQTMILCYQPECIVNTGVAGALSDKLSIGSVAISSAVVCQVRHSPAGVPSSDSFRTRSASRSRIASAISPDTSVSNLARSASMFP